MKKLALLSSPRLIILFAFVIMVVLSFISFTRIRTMNELSTQVDHSNRLKLVLQETYSDISDADSELSKYILTSDTSYYKKMIRFEEKIQLSIQRIKALTNKNEPQYKAVAMLEGSVQKRFGLMNNELQAANNDYKNISQDITKSNQEIISTINLLKDNESKTLTEAEKSAERYKVWTPLAIFSLEIIVVLFLVVAYFKTHQQLSIKRGLQKELEDQVYFTRAVIDNSVDLIFVLDSDLNLVMANKRCNELLGMSEAMIGKNILTLFPMAVNSKSHDGILRALKGEYVHIENHKAQSIDRTLESFFIPLYKQEKVGSVILIHHDITELVKASQELELKNEQLLKSNADLEQFAYVASHDLQEPLRKVIMYSQLVQNEKEQQKLSAYLSKISDSANRMSNLITKVLQFSRASFSSSEFEAVDLNTVYKQVIQDLELLIEEKRATVNSSDLPIVNGYSQHLSQVFLNLIHNSIKYCDKEPIIAIRCTNDSRYHVISISDNGVGFEASYKDQIFEIFKRLPNQKNYSGTGIGLAVCKKIITNHKGTITVESEPGKGATFELRLPVRELDTA